MNFDLKRPCADCPFRADDAAIDLRPGRLASIVEELRSDDRNWFVCHKTIPKQDQSQCVGAMVYLLKIDAPSVSMRMAAAFGRLRFDELRALNDDVIDPDDIA